MTSARKWAFGLALLAATLGAGIGLANAQTGPSAAPTTDAPAPDAPDRPDRHPGGCPHRDGARDRATADRASAGSRLVRV